MWWHHTAMVLIPLSHCRWSDLCSGNVCRDSDHMIRAWSTGNGTFRNIMLSGFRFWILFGFCLLAGRNPSCWGGWDLPPPRALSTVRSTDSYRYVQWNAAVCCWHALTSSYQESVPKPAVQISEFLRRSSNTCYLERIFPQEQVLHSPEEIRGCQWKRANLFLIIGYNLVRLLDRVSTPWRS